MSVEGARTAQRERFSAWIEPEIAKGNWHETCRGFNARKLQGHDEGFEKGLRMNVEETYLQGAADAENFMIRAEAEVLQERRRLWDEEIGA